MRVLVVASHFDDAELGCGGTLIRHVAQKDEVFIAVTHSKEWRTGKPVIRRVEQIGAMMKLGVKSSQLIEGPSDHAEPFPFMVGKLGDLKPDRIYLHWPQDTHQDHVIAWQIGLAVSRKGADFLYYDSGSAMNFLPNYFVEIDWKKKKRLLDCFKSQKGHMNIFPANLEGFSVGRLSWR